MFKGTDPIFSVTNDLFSRGCLARMWTFSLSSSCFILCPCHHTNSTTVMCNTNMQVVLLLHFLFTLPIFLSNVGVSRPDKNTLFWQTYPLRRLYALKCIDVHFLLIKYVVAKLIARHVRIRRYSPCNLLSVHHVNKSFK